MRLIFHVLTTSSQILILDTWIALSELKPDKYGLCWQNGAVLACPSLGLRGRAVQQVGAYAQQELLGSSSGRAVLAC